MGKAFTIEHNVPRPRLACALYPWDKMKPGDSFLVPTKSAGESRRTQKSLHRSGDDFCMRHRPDLRVSVRMVEGGVRAWLLNRTKMTVVAIERGRRA